MSVGWTGKLIDWIDVIAAYRFGLTFTFKEIQRRGLAEWV